MPSPASPLKTFDRTRVAYFVPSLEVGGTERSLIQLLTGLPNSDFEKHVICLAGFGGLADDAREAGAELHDLRYPKIRLNGRVQWGRLPDAVLAAPRLIRLLKKLRPNVLHTMIPVCNVIGAVAARFARVPEMHLACTKLSLGFYRDKNPLIGRLEDWQAKRWDLVHCKSRGILEEVARTQPIPREKMRVIYNGVDTSDYLPSSDAAQDRENRRQLRGSLGIPEEAIVVGMVANLWPYKGHADVLAACAPLVEQFPALHFLFVGRDEDGNAARLKDQATRLGVGERLAIAGERDDIPELMKAMDLLVSASHHEGFSNVLLEAMAARLPIVATNVGGNAEAVETNVSGLIVEPGKPDQIRDAVRSLVGNEGRRRRMGLLGGERVDRLFSREAMIAGMMVFYSELASTPYR